MDLRTNPAAEASLRGMPELRRGGGDPASMRKAARDFEAMALGALMQPMFESTSRGSAFGGGGKGEAAWAPMLVNEFARITASSGGLGIGDMVLRHMLATQERTRDAASEGAVP